MQIAYLGPPGTYSHEAALKKFPTEELVPVRNLEAVVEAIKIKQVDLAVLPIENCTNGQVNASLDALLDCIGTADVKAIGEVRVAVQHRVYSKYNLKEVEIVYSHPQVWGQVRHWMQANLPNAECIDASSTARAMQLALETNKSAAIAGKAVGIVNKMDALVDNVSDRQDNTTRFLVLANGSDKLTQTGKSVLAALKVEHTRAAALAKALGAFASHNVNLTFLTTRPRGNWAYTFVLEFDGSLGDENVQAALEDVRKIGSLDILGAYTKDQA